MKVLFLDRDGVINKYPGDTRYITSWKEFEFIPGSIEAIAKFNQEGFKIFVVSNQAGVAKGVYSQKELDLITKNMLSALKRKKAKIDGVYYCTHFKEANCLCRKPKTGLLEKALSDYNIKPALSFFAGDSMVDMEAARSFGAQSVLLLSGRERISSKDEWSIKPDYVFDNLLVASHYLCSHPG